MKNAIPAQARALAAEVPLPGRGASVAEAAGRRAAAPAARLAHRVLRAAAARARVFQAKPRALVLARCAVRWSKLARQAAPGDPRSARIKARASPEPKIRRPAGTAGAKNESVTTSVSGATGELAVRVFVNQVQYKARLVVTAAVVHVPAIAAVIGEPGEAVAVKVSANRVQKEPKVAGTAVRRVGPATPVASGEAGEAAAAKASARQGK